MSAEKAIEHISSLHKEFGVEHIYFQDDEFTVSHERVIKICDWMINNVPNLSWECLTRVSHVDDELLSTMAKAGCKSIMYGVETGYDDGLVKIKKGITLEQVKGAIKLTQKYGMIAKASFILGFPWESKKEITETIDFAVNLDADYSFFTILCPFPTTEVYETIEKEGLLCQNSVLTCTARYLARRLRAMRNFSELRRNVRAGFSLLAFSMKSILKS